MAKITKISLTFYFYFNISVKLSVIRYYKWIKLISLWNIYLLCSFATFALLFLLVGVTIIINVKYSKTNFNVRFDL